MALKNMFNPKCFVLFCLGTALLLFSSCSAIDEKWDDCEKDFSVRVKYDYNMLGADAFTSQIESICFYVFDESGSFIKEQVFQGLFSSNTFSFDLPKGKYKFACVASDKRWENVISSWDTPVSPKTGFQLKDFFVSVKGIKNGVLSTALPSLWYASPVSPRNKEKLLQVEEYGIDELVLSLIRNTNNIRLIIQKNDESGLNPNDFNCAITGAVNAETDNKDELLPHALFDYLPYIQQAQQIKETAVNTGISVITAEWDVNRLFRNDKMRLKIGDLKTGKSIFDMELVPLLLMLKHGKHEKMPDQEFLDRQYEYGFYLLLDNNNQWTQLHIKVKDWIVRLNRMDI